MKLFDLRKPLSCNSVPHNGHASDAVLICFQQRDLRLLQALRISKHLCRVGNVDLASPSSGILGMGEVCSTLGLAILKFRTDYDSDGPGPGGAAMKVRCRLAYLAGVKLSTTRPIQ